MSDNIYSAIERYELIAELYYKRFQEMAPGKDRPAAMGAQSDEDYQANASRWSRYLDDKAFKDLETEVLELRDELANALLDAHLAGETMPGVTIRKVEEEKQ